MLVEWSSVSFSYFRVGMLAEQGAELARASGTPTCSDTAGPALFLFLATVLSVCSANVDWYRVDPHFSKCATAQTYIWVRRFTIDVQVPNCAEGWDQIKKNTLLITNTKSDCILHTSSHPIFNHLKESICVVLPFSLGLFVVSISERKYYFEGNQISLSAQRHQKGVKQKRFSCVLGENVLEAW